MSPVQLKLAAVRWQCAVFHEGDWLAMQCSYQSLLQVPGTVTRKVGDGTGYKLVLKSCEWGCLAWPVTAHGTDRKTVCLDWGSPGVSAVEYLCVTDHSQWESVPIVCVPPSSRLWAPSRSAVSLELVRVGARRPLLQMAAQHGFKGTTVPNLRKLFSDLKVAVIGKRPLTEVHLVESLAKFALPSSTAADVETYFLKRDATAEGEANEELAKLLDEHELLSSLADDMDEEDEELLEKMAQQVERARARAEKNAAKQKDLASLRLHSPVQGPAASSSRPVAKRIPFVLGRGLTQKEAKAFCPPGASLSKDVVRHMRWQIRADYCQPSVSKVFRQSAEQADNSALLHCLRIAWHKYTLSCGEPCPWSLDGDLFG